MRQWKEVQTLPWGLKTQGGIHALYTVLVPRFLRDSALAIGPTL